MSQEIDIEKELAELLSESLSAPFLFIGSGFSRRYLDLPDWKGLLSHFSTSMPFDSYLGTADNDFPKAALALAKDFSKEWWSLNKDRTDIYKSANWAPAVETPLKYEIAQYLSQVDINSKIHNNDELKELLNENVVIDGIITTNWDKLLENLFPTLKVYIGQSDLFFKHPQSIGEIFKIHGCISKFPSLILSKNDYENFNKKNAYLAAKLLSIFLENPVIFIGYSITDKNITDLLELIADMMESSEQLERLGKNLIFLTRPSNDKEAIESVLMTVGDRKLYFTHIRTNDFSKVYKALQYSERKIPVHLLRIFKEQIYNIVKTTEEADRRIAVKDFDEATADNSEIEFVVGVGVAQNESNGSRGLSGIGSIDICKDIVFDDLPFQDIDVLKESLPQLSKQNRTYLPVQKYFKADPSFLSELDNYPALKSLCLNDLTYYEDKINPYVKRKFDTSWVLEDIKDRADSDCSINKKLDFLALWLINNQDVNNCMRLKAEFLQPEFDNLKEFADSSTFRRLICILDQIENKELNS
ncbi:hypothetical protein SD67_04750 [Acinetobacter pittii]|uniref:SIR2 family protein n=1 Tax=Acinetobacter pittii TaxID=48296 RepID=UPI000585A6D1|nr:SIR2 family protein [Acinetobacter pittii]KIE86733.1 hypothetical protein SD67_04750 [Acinetobacter pittii]